MGRQVRFWMLPEDSAVFFEFLRRRDPIVVVERDSDSPEVSPIKDPAIALATACLWSKALLPELARQYILREVEPYYRVDSNLPVLEFWPRQLTEWQSTPALLQWKIWGGIVVPNERYRLWYEALVRWIRKHYTRHDPLHGYLGPSARDWHMRGGLLLPPFLPPPTDAWLAFFGRGPTVNQ